MEIAVAAWPDQLEEARALYREYYSALPVEVNWPAVEQELEQLAARFDGTSSLILVATGEGAVIGAVGLRRLSDRDVELSHMYVRPDRRRRGLGRALLEAALAAATDLGYERVRLETVTELVEAIALYRSAGFVPVEPYQAPPLATSLFMELDMGRKG